MQPSSTHLDCSDLAALYALGSLETDEMLGFRDHLRLGCARCRSALNLYDDVAAWLYRLVCVPPSELARPRMLRRIRGARAGRRPRRGRPQKSQRGQ